MHIVPHTEESTKVSFLFERENELIHTIPAPTALWLLSGSKGGQIVTYELWGEFTKKAARAYLNDVILRYMQTYDCEHCDTPATDAHFDSGQRYDLKIVAAGLESLKRRCSTFPETKRIYAKCAKGGGDDRLFWTCKEWCETQIRRGDCFTEFDLKQVILSAGGTYSQAKAKAKAIFAWYKQRNFKGSTRVHEMSRSDNMKRVNALRKNAAKQLVLETYNNMRNDLFVSKITAKAVAERSKIDPRTASKYLKELKEDGLI